MEKTQLVSVSGCLQRCLQANKLPVEDFFIVSLLILLIKPPSSTAQGYIPIKVTVIMEDVQCLKAVSVKKVFILEAVVHQ